MILKLVQFFFQLFKKDVKKVKEKVQPRLLKMGINARSVQQSVNVLFGDNETVDIEFSDSIEESSLTALNNDFIVVDNEPIFITGLTAWEPLNRSNTEAMVVNGITTDLAYNDTAPGLTQGWIIGVDLGPNNINRVNYLEMTDWTNLQYIPIEFEVIGTNDATGTLYEVLTTVTDHTPSSPANPFVANFPLSEYRYYGIRIIRATDPDYVVISEIKVANVLSNNTVKYMENGTEYEALQINTNILRFTNKGGAKNIKLILK